MTPCATAPAAGAARRHDRPRRIARRRELQRLRRPAAAARRRRARRSPACRMVSTYGRPIAERRRASASAAPRRSRAAAAPCGSTTMTPSTMPARIASMRARSRACSPSRRPTSCTESSSARATVPSSSSPKPRRGGVRSPLAVPLGDAGDEPHAPADARREDPGDGGAAEQRDAERGQRRRQHRAGADGGRR